MSFLGPPARTTLVADVRSLDPQAPRREAQREQAQGLDRTPPKIPAFRLLLSAAQTMRHPSSPHHFQFALAQILDARKHRQETAVAPWERNSLGHIDSGRCTAPPLGLQFGHGWRLAPTRSRLLQE